MRILQLAKFYDPYKGGIETVTKDLTEGLNEIGMPCDVLCCNDKYKDELHNRTHYSIIKTKSFGSFCSTSIAPKIIFKLQKIQNKYDIIHVHLPNPLANLAIVLTNPKAKIVIHWHSDIVKQKNLIKLYRPLQDKLLRRADLIIATSHNYSAASEFLQEYMHKIKIVPIGINQSDSYNIDLCRQIKDNYAGKKIIFSLGRLIYYKGFKYLVESAKFLNDDIVILIGGTGELYDELNDLIKKHSLENKVKLLGRLSDDEVHAYFNACDIFCLPSIARSEAFGVVLLEAMRARKPIIATNIEGSGVNWVNQHKLTGLNVEPENPENLADAVINLINDTEFYNKCCQNSYERFSNEFTKQQMVTSIAKSYTELLN